MGERQRSLDLPCLLVALLAIGAGSRSAQADGARVDIPIAQAVLPNGDIRYSVPVSIGGGAPVEAALDTGSFGLRVLARALNSTQYEATDQQRRYAFGSGVRFNGVLANGQIAVGDAKVAGPMLFQLVQSVDCMDKRPKCPATKLDAKDYRIAGSGYAGQGYDAILGVSMRKAPSAQAADNPLAAIGSGRWIVVLPRPGQPSPGHLIVDPDENEIVGFTLFRLEPQPSQGGERTPGWRDMALEGCLTNATSNNTICGETLLDSGAPGFSVNSTSASRATSWPEGTEVKLHLKGGDKPLELTFKVSTDTASKVRVMPANGQNDRVSAGSLPYYSYSVLYDQKNGLIGLKHRDDN